ncbi:cytochrome c oxidase subunit 6A COX6A [Phycomyces blakesleeanus]|uniref:Cytochrome c oxidase subunit 6A COX6A n=2 Tax=Phycomyces blakesleeanus TaxID=4837 RepID=A0A167QBP8_PHYB8|nr:cytochrome c oxidase subunit 6A COX6A [Phycomyces blakesleeanus NRRL 1555(-)]OAD79434.1 cytochrome c oxidase subunit 6A COX6A [Phycomyces blakesleeanus NRRL 1555(-)]|eukprot:XP_018297474.1 cytochrome c oxidase subunit 6A COX6A [Phycomyces blakesleeanus NRRL 1555(-)]
MASRALFNTQLINTVKRAGARSQSSLAATEFLAEREAVKHHAADAAGTWLKISIFVCIPALAAAGFNAYNLYSHHVEHLAHHPPQYIKYPYINFRAKDFFWGKNSLFFNPKVNFSAEE